MEIQSLLYKCDKCDAIIDNPISKEYNIHFCNKCVLEFIHNKMVIEFNEPQKIHNINENHKDEHITTKNIDFCEVSIKDL